MGYYIPDDMIARYIFRAKRVDNGAWETGSLITLSKLRTFGLNAMFGEAEECTTFIADKISGYPIPVDSNTINQCTGLKDKNGVFIFEGDLIEWDGVTLDTYEIMYGDDGSFFGHPVNGKGERVAGESLSLLNSDLAIVLVGNIHDVLTKG